jgi:hypothetical protein
MYLTRTSVAFIGCDRMRRGRLLMAALGFAACSMPSYNRALWALRSWLDSWAGIGRIAVGMAHQGFDLQLTRYDDRGWRATFYTSGIKHSPTSATGTGWERTPWHAPPAAPEMLHFGKCGIAVAMASCTDCPTFTSALSPGIRLSI